MEAITEAIIIGQSGTATTTVTNQNTARTVGSGSLDVFSTPMMIALMEAAACQAIEKNLSPEESTVGINVNIQHTKPSGLGDTITATATVTEVNGKKITFTIIASDSTGQIGNGTHARFIINATRFMEKLEQR